MKSRFALAATALFALASSRGGSRADPAAPRAPTSSDSVVRAARASEKIVEFEYDDARKELAGGDPDSSEIAIAKALLSLFEGDCDGAVAILARPELARLEQGEAFSDVARGCARVTAATVVDRDERQGIEIRYQDEDDRALTPLISETVVRARDALARDLGATWPKPTRITVVRDLASLAAMTGLSREAAMTTGTVAIAKWGRVTLLSPRASRNGYAWRDTVAHELTHLAISRATAEHTPLWLQEGLAKREEVRWRDPGPFDDRPSPESVVARGIELKLDLPLDKLGPSIAMLPSADAAMVAFAEVTSFVRYLATSSSPDALVRLLAALRNRKTVDQALVEATGADFHQWEAKWRAFVTAQKAEPLPQLFGLGAHPVNFRDARERVRLAELLLGRAHPKEALAELDKITGTEMLRDASVRHLRARVLEALGTVADAEALVADPKEVAASYGPWWAVRGRWARVRGDGPTADAAFVEAVAADPYDVEAACESLDPASSPAPPDGKRLCDAARKMGDPPLGTD